MTTQAQDQIDRALLEADAARRYAQSALRQQGHYVGLCADWDAELTTVWQEAYRRAMRRKS